VHGRKWGNQMPLNLILLILVCVIPVFQKNAPVKQSQTIVEVWCGGDDNLTQGLCRAVDSGFASSTEFIFSSEAETELNVTILTNVDWKQRGNRTRVFYKVEFTTIKDKKLGTKKGECWEDEFKTCASQVIRHARSVVRKLNH
jgi:hypothetical protein